MEPKISNSFFLNPLLEGINLSGKKVLEAMCGSGSASQYLVNHCASVTGLDISQEAIVSFKRRCPQSESICGTILKTPFLSNSFDCVVVVGGLHHLHPNLNEAVVEIHRVLKPGGFFCFAEPHKGSWLDWARIIWYRFDPLFAKNEASVDLTILKKTCEKIFDFKKEHYGGSLAYLAVWNSLVLRIPKKIKSLYSPALMWLEKWFQRLQGKRISCFVICQWQKI